VTVALSYHPWPYSSSAMITFQDLLDFTIIRSNECNIFHGLENEVISVPEDVLLGTNQMVASSILVFKLHYAWECINSGFTLLYPTLETTQLPRMTSRDHTALSGATRLYTYMRPST
jgi:hypothetical protein